MGVRRGEKEKRFTRITIPTLNTELGVSRLTFGIILIAWIIEVIKNPEPIIEIILDIPKFNNYIILW